MRHLITIGSCLFLSFIFITGAIDAGPEDWNMLRGVPPPQLKKDVKPPVRIVRPANYHYHQCPFCSYIWGYVPGDSHVCPSCGKVGRGNYVHYTGPIPLRLK